MLTPYHARYIAALLSQRWPMSQVERYLPALLSASIDLHPHQIEAALFASRSQFQNGVILADEEGLGKTIEAGIALLQASIEDKNNLLVLCPPNLLPHWQSELEQKFSLASISLEQWGHKPGIVLLSYNQAYQQADKLAAIRWHLCVLDAAHLLANANLSERKMADSIRNALAGCPKLLLTASPMQNSLLDLYYLLRFIDDTMFGGSPELFRSLYMGSKAQDLIDRARMVCQRTLKAHALTMPSSERHVRTIVVEPSAPEAELSQQMSAYFHRQHLAAFPKIAEHRVRLLYWKLLASSPLALHEGLQKPLARLSKISEAAEERAQLQAIADMALGITATTRSQAFLQALAEAFAQLEQAGAPRKAVVFSENKVTLQYLHGLLSQNGYKAYIHEVGNKGTKAVHALRQQAILLSTDSAAVGLDLSYCALVVNYDLPWNVQKLEARIARCHRYGQKRDVLVINFIDPSNRADKRLYHLLNRKLKSFDQVFGSTETVLGKLIEDGQLELDIRTEEEVSQELLAIEQANETEIAKRVNQAEADLLAYFDANVQERFAQYGQKVAPAIGRMEGILWELVCYALHNKATVFKDNRQIMLNKQPYKDLHLSHSFFGMDKDLPKGERLHFNHPLVKRILRDCLETPLSAGSLTLPANGKFQSGMSGQLGLWQLHMLSQVSYASCLVFCGLIKDIANNDCMLYDEDCVALLNLPPLAHSGGVIWQDSDKQKTGDYCSPNLAAARDKRLFAAQERLLQEQNEQLKQKVSRLQQWAEDEKAAHCLRQEEINKRIKQLKLNLDGLSGFNERFQFNKEIAELEQERRREQEKIFYQHAETAAKRDTLLEEAEAEFKTRFWHDELFVIYWKIV